MMWLAVDAERLAELDRLNSLHEDRNIMPLPGERGGLLVGVYLLGDCGEGQYWEDYGEWLRSLPETDEVPVQAAAL